MTDLAWGARRCPRCGHGESRPTDQHTTSRVMTSLRRALGLGHRRRRCSEPMDLGWLCLCRSRFHGDFGLPADVARRLRPAGHAPAGEPATLPRPVPVALPAPTLAPPAYAGLALLVMRSLAAAQREAALAGDPASRVVNREFS